MSESKGPRVVLLGAGASRASDYRLPLMKGFFTTDVLTPDTTRKGEKYDLLWNYLREYHGAKRSKAGKEKLSQVNLEEVITHFHNIEHGLLPIDAVRKAQLQRAYKQLDAYVYYRLAVEGLRSLKDEKNLSRQFYCKKHESIFHALALLHDSIISINYDLVADGTLQEMGETQGRTSDARSSRDQFRERSRGLLGFNRNWEIKYMAPNEEELELGYYLKLHGSLDYYYCPNPSCPQHHTFFPNRGKAERFNVPETSFCKLCGRQIVNAIIPPALGKSMDEFPRINVIWSMAFNKLRDADRWIIWGISLAESDHLLRTLLREAAHEGRRQGGLEVIVINPCEISAERVKKVVQSRVLRYCDVTDYLEGREACTVD